MRRAEHGFHELSQRTRKARSARRARTGIARRLRRSPCGGRPRSIPCSKFDPRTQIRNPVMFVVWLGALVTAALTIDPDLFGPSTHPRPTTAS